MSSKMVGTRFNTYRDIQTLSGSLYDYCCSRNGRGNHRYLHDPQTFLHMVDDFICISEYVDIRESRRTVISLDLVHSLKVAWWLALIIYFLWTLSQIGLEERLKALE